MSLLTSTRSTTSRNGSTTISIGDAAVVAVGLALAVAANTGFCIGYWTALFHQRNGYWPSWSSIKKKVLQQIQNSTSGCIILQDFHSITTTTIPAPRRFGACIQLKPDQYIAYRTLHDNVWDQVQQRLHDSHIRNFTIYYHPETSTLYQHFEWIGHWSAYHHHEQRTGTVDAVPTTLFALSVEEERALLDADLYAIAQDPVTREWWKLCEPCQQPFAQWFQQQQQPPPHSNNDDAIQLLLPSEGNTTGNWWAPMECICHTGHYPIAYTLQTFDPDYVKMKDK